MDIAEEAFDIPIVLITFNRPELVRQQLERLRRVKPEKIFFVSDGARQGKGEDELVQQTRNLVNTIDWQCDIETIYAENNLGCDERVVSALNFVFSKVEQAVILEDDCLPALSFFSYCKVLLEKYADCSEIMYISGTKWVPNYSMDYSYGFSYNTGTWGWATWKRAWQEWHWDRQKWEEEKEYWLEGVYSNKYRKDWIRDFERYLSVGQRPWDYVWRFCVGKRLSIFPSVNLISNIGFGENATHTKEEMHGYSGKVEEMERICHPPYIYEDKIYPHAIEKQFKRSIFTRIVNRFKRK